MKKDKHPKYQDVLFVDSSTGYKFVCGSTLQPEERQTHEGKEYPVQRVSISSASHPFFTGSKKLVDSQGRVDNFNKRYRGQKRTAEAAEAEVVAEEPKAKKAKKK
jgi:large subunit ribosomal protein L31